MERIRLGNNIAISWALYDLNGRVHSLENKEVQLYMSCGGLKQAVTDYTIQGNVVSWVFLGTEQKKVGLYKLILVETDALSGAQVVDVAEAFRLVSETLSAVETGEVTKNVSVRSVLTYSNLVGVESVDVVESSEDGGTNLVSIRLVDGNVVEIPIKNGSKGDTGATGATGATGPKGDKGDIGERGPAGIDSVEASIGTNDPTQAPSVDKDLTEGVLSLTFNNIKGQKGDKGDQGNSGFQGDYTDLEIVNGLEETTVGKALDATQGKALDSKIGQLGQWFEKKTLTNDFQSGYTYYEDGHRDSNSAPATMLIQNKGYKAVKCTLGFDGDSYGAICFYSTSEQTTEGYIKSASIQSKAQASAEYFAYVPDNCVLIAVCNRPWTLGSPIVNIYQDVNKTIEELDLKIDNAENASVFGVFNVDVSNGQVTASGNVDVYFSNQFERFTNGTILFTITKVSGTNAVSFNPQTRQFVYGSSGINIGCTSGRYLYLNSKYTEIHYSNGKSDEPTRLLTERVVALEGFNSVIDNNAGYIPPFINEKGYETWKRVMSWGDGDGLFLLAQITDVHSGNLEKYKHIGYLNFLNKLYGFNILANTGDIGTDYHNDETEEEDNALLENTKRMMNCTSPWLYCKGNHEGKIVDVNKKLGFVFNRPLEAQFAQNVVFGDENKTYGYYDTPILKIRTFFINTTETDDSTNGYVLTYTQAQFVADSLAALQAGWNAIVISHFMIDDIGRLDGETSYRYGIWDNFCLMLEGFNAKNNGWRGELRWDFRESDAGKIICFLSGDSHFNNHRKYNGLNYIVRQGYGSMSSSAQENLPEGATYDSLNVDENCCFDVLAVKFNGNAKIFRIGVGGSERDLAFTY